VNEATSASVAQQLIRKGYKNVYALKGGWLDWEKAKYPVEQ
jgi:rhodanese-related sulfurtransferase